MVMMRPHRAMNAVRIRPVLLLVVAGLVPGLGVYALSAEIRAGVAAVDITPPMGISLAGYYHERGADGVLDPLFSKAMVIALGKEIAWVSLPGEIFVELGLAIKKRSPFAQTFLVELGNEDIGYIPDRRSYAEGNYEPESARCAAGSGERLVEAAVRLLGELHQ